MSSNTQKDLIAWVNAALDGKRGAKATLARRLDLTQDKISRSLKGEREFSFGEVIEMAKMFGRLPPGLEGFLGGEPHVSPQIESKLEEIERKIEALARHLGLASSEGRPASAAAAGRKLSARSATLRAAKPRGPAPDPSPQGHRKSKSEDPPSGSGDQELS